jgi:hypothetical protein
MSDRELLHGIQATVARIEAEMAQLRQRLAAVEGVVTAREAQARAVPQLAADGSAPSDFDWDAARDAQVELDLLAAIRAALEVADAGPTSG